MAIDRDIIAGNARQLRPIKSMKKILTVFLSIALTSVLVQAQSSTSDGPKSNRPTVDKSSVIVQLKGNPLSTYVKTKPPPGKKIDFSSTTVKSYRAQLSAERNDFKQWLQANAPKAKITGQYDISLNAVAVQLNGTAKSTIEQAPQAQYVEYEGIYYPTQAACGSDPDLAIISAIAAWNVNGGFAQAGENVKVAIIDTGIDITHPCFNDAGYPSQTKIYDFPADAAFTNNKVIAAKVFNNKAGVNGYTAEAIQEHGTHVAGTVGCNYQTPVGDIVGVAPSPTPVPIPYCPSGVAPRVLLGNYNVFPDNVTNARSEDILNALEAAYADGFDIDNMSLGGGPGKNNAGLTAVGNQDLLTMAVDDLDQAGMISAVAAGNSGPGFFTVESPGSAARALTAGASSVGHFIATPVTVSGNPNPFGALAGEFATVSSDLTANLKLVTEGTLVNGISNACSALTAGSLAGKIALISRGGCTFSAKIRNAQNAGAVAALVVNNQPGIPIPMGQDGTANQPTIPAYMVSLADGPALAADNGLSTTIGVTLQYVFNSVNNNFMADFSSQGPTAVDFRVKPDAVAPGLSVLSSIPLSFCGGNSCWEFLQGTSMATPHLAGSAAVVKGQHPSWSSAQIRSAIVNTADQNVLKHSTIPPAAGTLETDVNIIGAGLDDLLSAVNAKVALDPVSVSFGAVPSGSGQTKTYNVAVTNLSGGPAAFSVSVGSSTGTGVSYSVSPSSTGSLAAGASANVTVTMTATKVSSLGGHQATLNVSGGGGSAHAAVFTYIK
jgi:minor extracellular serine protease Vpr